MAQQKSSSALTAPLRGAASVLRRVPGAGMVSRAAEETLDKVGALSPRGRRIAVYTGAGVLGAAGVVEWPVALTGAAVAWLTQPRPGQRPPTEPGPSPEPAHDLGTAALRSGHGSDGAGGTASATAGHAGGGTATSPPGTAPGGTGTAGHARTPGSARTARGDEDPAVKPATGPLGPTARPDRTTL